MKKTLFALLLAASATMTSFAGPRVVIGIGVNLGGPVYYAPAPPPPVVAYQPPCPGPGYVWTTGYWSNSGPRRFWTPSYWAPPVVRGGYYREDYREHSREDYREHDRERREHDRDHDRDRHDFGRPEYHGFRR